MSPYVKKVPQAVCVLIGRAALLLVLATFNNLTARAAEISTVIPAPAFDPPQAASDSVSTAVLAGGCFWGVQAVFQHVKGVESAVSGYAGGDKALAHYPDVSTGRTGHAESVQVIFNPRIITYGQILQIYFSVAHDPTQLDRQGPDVGTQYRSAIFYADESQRAIAERYIAQLDKVHAFRQRIETRLESLQTFYPAESYHQDYLVLHPYSPYIVINDLPKIENLRRLYADLYRAEPKLVVGQRSPN
ncbi:MAG TPA: peptide-methionine (S)-S-oxide reductase MsrA [Xanthobacteraceae bacterium]|nr:peptide-methionine (S)-S-oxide reductase MsrA [Xanthobacteraceae bacterium]